MRQAKKKLRLALRRAAARWLRLDRDARLTGSYLNGTRPRKLHIGCGPNILSGWLNADCYPKTRDVLRLDATRALPFADGTFDYVFSEHMIEHFPFADGQKMLCESRRVLAPGGVLRVSTPDLAFLVDLYRREEPPRRARAALQSEFLEHFLATEIERPRRNAPRPWDSFLINRFVRAWGHEFIYDEKTLRYAMEEAGFTDIVRRKALESEHEALRGLENVERKPAGHLDLESMVLEATRP